METIKFEVVGAGNIVLSKDPHCICGGAAGFHLHVTWSSPNRAGGVLGRGEALKLAEFITEACKGIEKTEEQEVTEAMIRLKNS